MRTAAGVLAVAALLLASCGDGEDEPLAAAEDAMADLRAGHVRLQLSATAGDDGAGPIGFRVEGPFSFEGDTEIAVVDLTYTRLLGDEELTSQVLSTGDAVYVVTDGDVAEVPAADAGELRLGDGSGGVADLGIAGWVRDPQVEESDGGGRVVTGEVAVADLLADLARIGAQLGDGETTGVLDDEAAQRLQGLARSSSAEVELGDDDLPRAATFVVDFGGEVPEELREALGPYASARLELTLAVAPLSEPLVVAAPEG